MDTLIRKKRESRTRFLKHKQILSKSFPRKRNAISASDTSTKLIKLQDQETNQQIEDVRKDIFPIPKQRQHHP